MQLNQEQVAAIIKPRTKIDVTWPLTQSRPPAHRLPFIVCYSRFTVEGPVWSWNFTSEQLANLDKFRNYTSPNRANARGNHMTARAKFTIKGSASTAIKPG